MPEDHEDLEMVMLRDLSIFGKKGLMVNVSRLLFAAGKPSSRCTIRGESMILLNKKSD